MAAASEEGGGLLRSLQPAVQAPTRGPRRLLSGWSEAPRPQRAGWTGLDGRLSAEARRGRTAVQRRGPGSPEARGGPGRGREALKEGWGSGGLGLPRNFRADAAPPGPSGTVSEGSQRALGEPSAAPPPRTMSPPDAEATSLQGTAAEAHPPSARSGEPQSGPPAAAGRTRRLRGQVTGRVPARPSLSATWDLTGIAGETCVTWRNGHVPRAGHVQGGRGAEPELARSREIRGGHVTARERCGLT
uniref:Uncharacterized protein n=1 Tax=Rangifer tarandus platyrhynchus TaxID=3082113 RepID=A0ACB0FH64_RANTA|nr:unnamed protein product [Rangifer tarandus platyrhynchus]